MNMIISINTFQNLISEMFLLLVFTPRDISNGCGDHKALEGEIKGG